MNLENKKQIATILLAVGLGLVAAFLTSQYVEARIKQKQDEMAKEVQKRNTALVKEIEYMRKQVEKVKADQKRLSKEQQAQIKKQIALASAMGSGGKKSDGAPPPSGVSFSVRTPSGKRAYTLLIDSLSAVGGLVNPGDFVDVIGKLKIPDPSQPKKDGKFKKEEVTSVIFQNVQVLAVGTVFKATGSPDQYTVQQKARSLKITIALEPEEVGLMTFAQSHGKLMLSLRSPNEKGLELLQVASWDALSDYVLERQGTELAIPKQKVDLKPGRTEERDSRGDVKPFIQIYRGGRQ